MALDLGNIIGSINLLAALLILFFGIKAVKKFKKAEMVWATYLLLISGILFVVHAAIEIGGLGEGLYAVSGLVLTLIMGFTIVLFDINVRSILEK